MTSLSNLERKLRTLKLQEGPPGEAGADGVDGTPGSLIYFSQAFPSFSEGNDNDVWLVWATSPNAQVIFMQKIAGNWEQKVSITGVNISGPSGGSD